MQGWDLLRWRWRWQDDGDDGGRRRWWMKPADGWMKLQGHSWLRRTAWKVIGRCPAERPSGAFVVLQQWNSWAGWRWLDQTYQVLAKSWSWEAAGNSCLFSWLLVKLLLFRSFDTDVIWQLAGSARVSAWSACIFSWSGRGRCAASPTWERGADLWAGCWPKMGFFSHKGERCNLEAGSEMSESLEEEIEWRISEQREESSFMNLSHTGRGPGLQKTFSSLSVYWLWSKDSAETINQF